MYFYISKYSCMFTMKSWYSNSLSFELIGSGKVKWYLVLVQLYLAWLI